MRDAGIASMIVGLAFLVGVSFVTPGILLRFGLPAHWAEQGAAIYAVCAAISAIGGVLWWLGWRRDRTGG